MFEKDFISKIDAALEKYHFRKVNKLWNRECGDFVDAIDLQVSKSRDSFTMNFGVAEKVVLQLCWGLDSSSSVDEASCTVRARLGALMCDRDIWWPLSDGGCIDEVLYGIENMAIPFLQLNHSIDRMIETLENSLSSRSYPPETIYLALLYNRKGDGDRSRKMLIALHAKVAGGWRQKVSEILDALN